MARPKINPDAPSKATSPEQAIELGELDVSDIAEDRPFDQTLAQKIEFATDVLNRKKELLKELQDVRELCTLLVNTGSGDREQVAWVRFYLPRKTRKAGTEADEDE